MPEQPEKLKVPLEDCPIAPEFWSNSNVRGLSSFSSSIILSQLPCLHHIRNMKLSPISQRSRTISRAVQKVWKFPLKSLGKTSSPQKCLSSLNANVIISVNSISSPHRSKIIWRIISDLCIAALKMLSVILTWSPRRSNKRLRVFSALGPFTTAIRMFSVGACALQWGYESDWNWNSVESTRSLLEQCRNSKEHDSR